MKAEIIAEHIHKPDAKKKTAKANQYTPRNRACQLNPITHDAF